MITVLAVPSVTAGRKSTSEKKRLQMFIVQMSLMVARTSTLRV
jgi:hypothetical protein